MSKTTFADSPDSSARLGSVAKCPVAPKASGTPACAVPSSVFYGAVAAHAGEWAAQFGAGMHLDIPYNERRQVDMARRKRPKARLSRLALCGAHA